MNILENLNDKQKEAVTYTKGPLLVLAGAGSGKTRVLTHRIAYLMQEKGVDPYNIMAITFTNKAAGEMRERVNAIAGCGADAVWVSTFHSACARILRRFADRLGYSTNFSIYDTDDAKTVIKGVLSRLEADQKKFTPKKVLSVISSAKNNMKTPDDLLSEAVGRNGEIYGRAMKLYNEDLFENNAMDFDDLLLKTVELFKKCPDVLEAYRERLKYICVDEYQDTNLVQFDFIRLLALKYRNLCVVGDDDQSIYKFRGADIKNILEFEKYFKDAHVVKLEQNYRSVGNVLKAANAVIANNKGRKVKTLWTAKPDGDLIRLRKYQTAPEEARKIVRDIRERNKNGEPLNSFAVLYRTNAQSRLIEEQLVLANTPYQIIGGVNFYSRKEIKDILAYLKTVANGKDDLAVKRIINIPKRGIGATSIKKIENYARINGTSFYDALLNTGDIKDLGRTAEKIEPFTTFIRRLKTLSNEISVTELIKTIMKETGYTQALIDENTDESKDRLLNLDELVSKAASYCGLSENPTLNGFLEEVALVADIDSMEDEAQKVLLLTIHSAKGLEFDNVYISGMEDGLFPSFHSVFDTDEGELEEERRLCYVGMTRAMKTLTLTMARERMSMGEFETHKVSRFVEEIPDELIDEDAESKNVFYDERPKEDYFDFSKRGGFERGRSSSSSFVFGRAGNGHTVSEKKQHAVFEPKEFKVTKPASLEYKKGDRVKHRKFGEGTVAAIEDKPKDFEVTVDFDGVGRKKMFAAFAKLEKI